MDHSILLHEPDDDVGVAVVDLQPGSEVGAVTLEGQHLGTVKVIETVPLGHKIAMRDLPEGKGVIEYGRAIGKAVLPVTRGAHVHTHNLRTQRWEL